jgi:hypothetical protein
VRPEPPSRGAEEVLLLSAGKLEAIARTKQRMIERDDLEHLQQLHEVQREIQVLQDTIKELLKEKTEAIVAEDYVEANNIKQRLMNNIVQIERAFDRVIEGREDDSYGQTLSERLSSPVPEQKGLRMTRQSSLTANNVSRKVNVGISRTISNVKIQRQLDAEVSSSSSDEYDERQLRSLAMRSSQIKSHLKRRFQSHSSSSDESDASGEGGRKGHEVRGPVRTNFIATRIIRNDSEKFSIQTSVDTGLDPEEHKVMDTQLAKLKAKSPQKPPAKVTKKQGPYVP